MRHFWGPAVVVLLAAGLAGCAKTQARTMPERPPLQVPEAPPRVVVPVAVEEPPEQEAPVEEEANVQPPAPRRARPAPPKADPKEESPAKEAPQKVAESGAPPAEAPQLQTPQTANDSQAERKIRDALTRAGRTLRGVNYGALNADARSQYDTAKRFIEQAEEALKIRNYVFASYLSDKADTLAKGLVGR
jgi:hypothetical protein